MTTAAQATATQTHTRQSPQPAGALIGNLQQVLIDLVALHVTLKQAHWTVTGPGFRSLHLAIDDIVSDAREYSDTVAERIRALRAVPDGRISTALAARTLPEFPFGEVGTEETVTRVVDLLRQSIRTVRRVHDDVDDADPTSADLLHVVIDSLERHVWLISAEAQR